MFYEHKCSDCLKFLLNLVVCKNKTPVTNEISFDITLSHFVVPVDHAMANGAVQFRGMYENSMGAWVIFLSYKKRQILKATFLNLSVMFFYSKLTVIWQGPHANWIRSFMKLLKLSYSYTQHVVYLTWNSNKNCVFCYLLAEIKISFKSVNQWPLGKMRLFYKKRAHAVFLYFILLNAIAIKRHDCL